MKLVKEDIRDEDSCSSSARSGSSNSNLENAVMPEFDGGKNVPLLQSPEKVIENLESEAHNAQSYKIILLFKDLQLETEYGHHFYGRNRSVRVSALFLFGAFLYGMFITSDYVMMVWWLTDIILMFLSVFVALVALVPFIAKRKLILEAIIVFTCCCMSIRLHFHEFYYDGLDFNHFKYSIFIFELPFFVMVRPRMLCVMTGATINVFAFSLIVGIINASRYSAVLHFFSITTYVKNQILIVMVIYSLNTITRIMFLQNRKRERHRNVAEREVRKTHKLLLNIFPRCFIKEVRNIMVGSEDYNVDLIKKFENGIMLQSDIVKYVLSFLTHNFISFTEFSTMAKSEEIVIMLNSHFSYFDVICQNLELEKITTAGDGYYVLGLNEHFASNCVTAGIAMIHTVSYLNIMKGWNLEIRVGVIMGNLYGYLFGSKRAHMSFDVYSSEIELLERLESSAPPSHVKVSREIFQATKDLYKYKLVDDQDESSVISYDENIQEMILCEEQFEVFTNVVQLSRNRFSDVRQSQPTQSEKSCKSVISSEPSKKKKLNLNLFHSDNKKSFRFSKFIPLAMSDIQTEREFVRDVFKKSTTNFYLYFISHVIFHLNFFFSLVATERYDYFWAPFVIIGYVCLLLNSVAIFFALVFRKFLMDARFVFLSTIICCGVYVVEFIVMLFFFPWGSEFDEYKQFVVGEFFCFGIVQLLWLQCNQFYLRLFFVFGVSFIYFFYRLCYFLLSGRQIFWVYFVIDLQIIFVMGLSIIVGIIICEYYNRKTFINQKRIQEIVKMIKTQREYHLSLILSVLPKYVMHKLKKSLRKRFIHHRNDFILFLCMSNLTSCSKPIEKCIRFCGKVFVSLDILVKKDQRHTIKIKNIRDSYILISTRLHSVIEIYGEIFQTINKIEEEFGDISLQAGLYHGEYLAAVIGEEKFLYDIFGKSVNISSRLCKKSMTGHILVETENMKKHVCDDDELFLEEKGIESLKGIGDVHTSYLMDSNYFGEEH